MEWISIELLKPHPKNPNKHGKDQIERLAQIIQYQGWRSPIIVSKLSGYIVAGHGRLLAAKKLGLKEVPVNYQDYFDADQEYAHLVGDNSIASWAVLDLSMINLDLKDLGPDFNVDLLGIKNFTIEVAEKIITSPIEEPNIEDFKGTEPKKMKFYTCPHCEQEFEEKQAMLRIQ